jgi:hypothetical protein
MIIYRDYKKPEEVQLKEIQLHVEAYEEIQPLLNTNKEIIGWKIQRHLTYSA